VAQQDGELRADPQRKSSPLGAYDLLIAAHALFENVREFSRVEGLRIENWVE
jgi:tRNA(fMet)-specific endonuclease VapC